MKKVVITGGAGFIGSHIAQEAFSRNCEVVILDNLHTGKQCNLEYLKSVGDYQFVEASVMQGSALDQAFEGADAVFHLAALISVPESMHKKLDYFNINTIGTLNVLDAAVRQGVGSVVLSSSAAIYGHCNVIPKTETMSPEPLSPYAISKLDGEYLCQLYRREHGLNATALRYFNVFGPRQDPASEYAAAVPIFIQKALAQDAITIFGDGQQTRDFIYVQDIVQANFLAAHKGGDVYNVAWGKRITIHELAQTIIALTGSSSCIQHLPGRAGDIKHSMADNQKIVKELGFKASCDFMAGLKETIQYYDNL